MTGDDLDRLHHVAIETSDVAATLAWYHEHFRCETVYADESWAMLRFANCSLALVSPGAHPPHIAFVHPDPGSFGELVPHRDGTASVYIKDDAGNSVELVTRGG